MLSCHVLQSYGDRLSNYETHELLDYRDVEPFNNE